MGTYALWAAIRTVKAKIGTWVGYNRAVEAGLDIDRAAWARWVGQARNAIAGRTLEMGRNLNLRPSGADIKPMETVSARGFMQTVVIYVKDIDTDVIRDQFFTIRGRDLRSRRSAVSEAIRRYQDAIDANPDDYPEEIVGASYWDTYDMTPGG